MKKLIFLFLSVFILADAKAQIDPLITRPTKDSLKLAYTVHTHQDGQFLVPYIDFILKQLTAQEEDARLFYKVTNVENIDSGIAAAIRIQSTNDAIEILDNRSNAKSKALKFEMIDYDKYLDIRINRYDKLLEYQFIMYDKTGKHFENKYSSSVFIDPMSDNYKEKLRFAIKQVCPEVNIAPALTIYGNKKPLSGTSDLYVFVYDTILIEALPYDPDSYEEELKYAWTADNTSLLEGNKLLAFSSSQLFTFKKSKNLHLTVIASDGISSSRKYDIMVHVIDKPAIEKFYIKAKNYTTFEQYYTLQSLKRKADYAEPDKFAFYTRKYLLKTGLDTVPNNLQLVIRCSSGSTEADSMKFSYQLNHDSLSRDEDNDYAIAAGSEGIGEFSLEKVPSADPNLMTYQAKDLASVAYFLSMDISATVYSHNAPCNSRKVRINFRRITQIYFEAAAGFFPFNHDLFSRNSPSVNAYLGIKWKPFRYLELGYSYAHTFSQSTVTNDSKDLFFQTGKFNYAIDFVYIPHFYNKLQRFRLELRYLSQNAVTGTNDEKHLFMPGLGVSYRFPTFYFSGISLAAMYFPDAYREYTPWIGNNKSIRLFEIRVGYYFQPVRTVRRFQL